VALIPITPPLVAAVISIEVVIEEDRIIALSIHLEEEIEEAVEMRAVVIVIDQTVVVDTEMIDLVAVVATEEVTIGHHPVEAIDIPLVETREAISAKENSNRYLSTYSQTHTAAELLLRDLRGRTSINHPYER